MASEWYAEGLAFRCTRCGNCCTGAPGVVWVADDEVAALAAFKGETVADFNQIYTRMFGERRSLRERDNGDCVFWDRAAGCTVYPVRPRQCQTWPFWNSNVVTPQEWKATGERCPGVGKGELIPVEEITRRLNLIRM